MTTSLIVCNMKYAKLCDLINTGDTSAKRITETSRFNEIKSLSFEIPLDNPNIPYIINENLILFNDEYYRIKTTSLNHKQDGLTFLTVTCAHLSETLQTNIITMEEVTPRTVIDLMKIALVYEGNSPTLGWSVGKISVDLAKKRGLEHTEQSSFSHLTAIAEKYDGILKFNSKNKTVDLVPRADEAKPDFELSIHKNLKNIEIEYNTNDMITRLYCFGGNDSNGNEISIMPANPTKKGYIENYNYFFSLGYTNADIIANPELFIKTGIWRDSNYYMSDDLYSDGIDRLEKLSVPKIEVRVEALDITQNTVLELGEAISVRDEDLGINFICNVIEITKNYDTPHQLNIELTNQIDYKNLLSQLYSQVSTTSQVITPSGTINGSKIDGINTNQVRDLDIKYASIEYLNAVYIDAESLAAQYAKFKDLEAFSAEIEDLKASSVHIEDLQVISAEIEDLKVNELTAINADIENIRITKANITDMEAIDAEIENLKVTKLDAEDLVSVNADINTLKADKANITDLTAMHADIEHLISTKAEVTDLDAAQGNINILDSILANIKTILAGSIGTGDLQTIILNAQNSNIENGLIKNAMIESLGVDKLLAGDISTNIIGIRSDDGSLIIADETLQISDENRVRVQIGKDANNDFNITIFDADGKLMFDAAGIHKDAIKDAIIRNDMVSPDANIDAGKININSLFSVINDDETRTIRGSKVKLDNENQTLDIIFNQMTTKISDVENELYNIEIGGRNLALNTNNGTSHWWWAMQTGGVTYIKDKIDGINACTITRNSEEQTGWSVLQFTRINRQLFAADSSYTIGFEIKSNLDIETSIANIDICDNNGKNTMLASKDYINNHVLPDKWNKIVCVVKTLEELPASTAQILYMTGMNSEPNASYTVRNLKIEKGTKPTDWTPAPEDIESEFSSVKNSVTTTNNNLSDFQDTVNGSFKDGVLQEAESKAIESYLNTLHSDNIEMNYRYTTIHNNPALSGTPQDNLISAKNTYNIAYTALIDTINLAIQDGKVTYVEKANVDSKFIAYRTALGNLSTRLEQAVSAIEGKLIEDVDNKVTNLSTQFNIQQGEIDTLISESSIQDLQNEGTTFYDKYTATKQTVDGIESVVSSHSSALIDISLEDKDVQHGNPIFTDKADNAVVHINIDGVGKQNGVPSPWYNSEIRNLNSFDLISSIGNRNIFPNSGYWTDNFSPWINNGGGANLDDSNLYMGKPTLKTTLGAGINGRWYKLEANQIYTYSALVKFNKPIRQTSSTPLHYHAGKNNVSQNKITIIDWGGDAWNSVGEYKLFYISFQLTGDADSFKPFLFMGSQYDITANVAYFKLEKGKQLSPWTPALEDISYEVAANGIYKTNISFEQPLRAIDNIKDIIFRDINGIWMIQRNIGEYIITGEEGWSTNSNSKVYQMSDVLPNSDINVSRYSRPYILCNKIPVGSYPDILDDFFLPDYGIGSSPDDPHKIIIKASPYPTLDDFILWISDLYAIEKPIILHYKLATPIIEVLSQSMQQKLNSIPSFTGGNYVYTFADVTPELHGYFKSTGWNDRQKTLNRINIKADKYDVDNRFDDITENYQSSIAQTSTSILATLDSSISSLDERLTETINTEIEILAGQLNLSFAETTSIIENNIQQISEINQNFTFSALGLEIGRTGSRMKMLLSNDRLSLMDGSNEAAYISSNKMFINNLDVVNSLEVGNHIIEQYNNELTLIKFIG